MTVDLNKKTQKFAESLRNMNLAVAKLSLAAVKANPSILALTDKLNDACAEEDFGV